MRNIDEADTRPRGEDGQAPPLSILNVPTRCIWLETTMAVAVRNPHSYPQWALRG